eukprot:5888290-Pyramimonas_sp.AAC.1
MCIRDRQKAEKEAGIKPLKIPNIQIPPWTTLAKCKGTCNINMDQCTTGLRDPHGVLMRKPTEIMTNHRLLRTPFERRRCAGHHQHAS